MLPELQCIRSQFNWIPSSYSWSHTAALLDKIIIINDKFVHINLPMPQVGLEPWSSVHQLCWDMVDDLNHSATMAGSVPPLLLRYFSCIKTKLSRLFQLLHTEGTNNYESIMSYANCHILISVHLPYVNYLYWSAIEMSHRIIGKCNHAI